MHEAADTRSVGVIVAHPDDETLWVGGAILRHPAWRCRIFTLCRGNDRDRAPKFYRVLEALGATGGMADLDDDPEQTPLDDALLRRTVGELVAGERFDLLFTHGPDGEYTRHRRHEETSRVVTALWRAGTLRAGALWHFAYEDGGRAYLPRPAAEADWRCVLPETIWMAKYRLIQGLYGFAPESWEARTTPREEAFRRVSAPNRNEYMHGG